MIFARVIDSALSIDFVKNVVLRCQSAIEIFINIFYLRMCVGRLMEKGKMFKELFFKHFLNIGLLAEYFLGGHSREKYILLRPGLPV